MIHLSIRDSIHVIHTMQIHEAAFLGPHFFFEKIIKNIQCPGPIYPNSRSFFHIHRRAGFALWSRQLATGKVAFAPLSRFTVHENIFCFPGIYFHGRDAFKTGQLCRPPKSWPFFCRKTNHSDATAKTKKKLQELFDPSETGLSGNIFHVFWK